MVVILDLAENINCKYLISISVQDGAISSKFSTPRVSAESTGEFSPKLFSRHFCDYLEFLRETQNAFILEMVRDEPFGEIFNPQGISRVNW